MYSFSMFILSSFICANCSESFPVFESTEKASEPRRKVNFTEGAENMEASKWSVIFTASEHPLLLPIRNFRSNRKGTSSKELSRTATKKNSCKTTLLRGKSRDAEDAIRGRDGYNFGGSHLKVELAHGGRGYSSSSGRSSRYGGGGAGKFGVSHRSEYRVAVRGLPSSASWQDLKDHMRKAGDVCFAQVFRDGERAMGLVDYTNYEDMKYAIRKLDDTEFRNPYGKSYIRVKIYEGSVSRSPSRSRSRSRSPRKRKSRSNSMDRHAVKRASKSISPRLKSASPARSSSKSRSA